MHTFPFDGLELLVADNVYEPAEDSFLLAKHAKNCEGRILDMCTGTGIVALTNVINNPKNKVVAIDRNPVACKNARENAMRNSISIDVREGDMFSPLANSELFAWIFCNPPYLPAGKEDHVQGALDYALNSGTDGREFLDRFLEEFGRFLKPGGKVLLIHSSYQNLNTTKKWLRQNRWKYAILEKEDMGEETLYCLLIESG